MAGYGIAEKIQDFNKFRLVKGVYADLNP